MLSKVIIRLLPVLWLAALPLFADGTAQVFVNGSYAFQDQGVTLSPYGGTLDGTPTEFICVDFSAKIRKNSGWTAAVTDLISSGGYGNTNQKDQTTYLEFAYLATKLLASTTELEAAEWEWALLGFTGGPDPYGTDAKLEAQAAAAVNDPTNPFTVSGWKILTPVGSYGQEFLVAAPEPGSLLLWSIGLFSAGVISIVRKRSRIA